MTTTEFTTKTGNKISFFNLQEKKCVVCKDIFLPKHPRTVYCDKKGCNTHAYKRLNRLERELKVTCNICKKEYIPRSLNNVGHCGSMSCLYEYKKRKNSEYKKRVGKEPQKKHHIKKYGLTIEQYEQMEKYQNYSCKICGIHKDKNSRDKNGVVKSLAIDHDHETGQIRGLLCNWCNVGLGGFKDNPSSLENAIKYLEGSKNSKIYMLEKNIPKKNSE